MRSNQLHARRLAPVASGAFHEAVCKVAGVALEIPTITEQDRQMLWDLRRVGRYQWRNLERMLDIIAQAPEQLFFAALTVLDDIRACLIARRRQHMIPSVRDALVEETAAEADANPDQLRAALESRNIDVVDRAIRKTDRVKYTVARLGDSLRVERVRLMHGGAQ